MDILSGIQNPLMWLAASLFPKIMSYILSIIIDFHA